MGEAASRCRALPFCRARQQFALAPLSISPARCNSNVHLHLNLHLPNVQEFNQSRAKDYIEAARITYLRVEYAAKVLNLIAEKANVSTYVKIVCIDLSITDKFTMEARQKFDIKSKDNFTLFLIIL